MPLERIAVTKCKGCGFVASAQPPAGCICLDRGVYPGKRGRLRIELVPASDHEALEAQRDAATAVADERGNRLVAMEARLEAVERRLHNAQAERVGATAQLRESERKLVSTEARLERLRRTLRLIEHEARTRGEWHSESRIREVLAGIDAGEPPE